MTVNAVVKINNKQYLCSQKKILYGLEKFK
jgi:hypothetical protein